MRICTHILILTAFAILSFPQLSFGDEQKTQKFPFTELTAEEAKILTSGKPLFIDFWASWCSPCKKSFPENNRLAKKFKAQVHFVAINEDQNEKQALAFLKEFPLEFPNIMDNQRRLAKMLQVKALPTLLIFDAEGNLVLNVRGYDPENLGKIEKTLERISKP